MPMWAKEGSKKFHSMNGGSGHNELVSTTFQLIEKINLFRDFGRTLSLHNLVRYAEGKGGYAGAFLRKSGIGASVEIS